MYEATHQGSSTSISSMLTLVAACRQRCCNCRAGAAERAADAGVLETDDAADTCETLQQVSNYVATHQILDDAVAITAEKYAHIRPRPHS